MDYEKLLREGIPGLLAEVQDRKPQNPDLFSAMEGALELLKECCLYYRDQALQLRDEASLPADREQLNAMADALNAITLRAPRTLRECIQLHWLYSLISGTYNYGRLDDVLGDDLVRDLETGVLTEAQTLLNGFWQLMADRNTIWNGRVILGGRGRKNEKNADLAARMMIEATRQIKEGEPQLSLRWYEGMDESLLDLALQSIREGRPSPILYNDDVNVSAVSKAFNVSIQEAEDYVPFGCGEYILDHRSVGSPNGIINLLKILEITLRNGRDAVTGKQIGLQTGEIGSFQTFEDLFAAYSTQVAYFVWALAEQEMMEYQAAGKTAPFLFLSMLYDDCLERGKALFSGGVHSLGGTLETYGNINTADSLTAIKKLVFDEKKISLKELLSALDADFVGYERLRKELKAAPKYGNDDAAADAMACRVHEQICRSAQEQAKCVGLDSYLIVIINNSANTTLGKLTAASPDGRKGGMHMANANNPFDGNDQEGLTAMLNSLVKLRADCHAGAVQNMKFSPELFQLPGDIVKHVIKTYFAQGGTQAMISVVNRGDLEEAMEHPEKYRNLFVRVGGFSARFVTLEKAVQVEILHRTLY